MTTRVLWLEEELHTLRYEQKLAELAGWDITSVSTVADAKRHVQDDAYQVVVADLILPLNDYESQRGKLTPEAGLDFLRFVTDESRKGVTSSNVLLVVLSAVLSPEVKQLAQACLSSPKYYIQKPVNEEIFRALLVSFNEKVAVGEQHSANTGE